MSFRHLLSLGRPAAAVLVLILAQCKPDGPTTPLQADPSIELSATTRSFTATAGGANPAAQSVQITNGGDGTLSSLTATTTYQPGQLGGWLSLSLNPGTAPATLQLTSLTTGLPAGTYNATVTIGSTVASNSPRSIAVSFVVNAPAAPTIGLSATSRSFTATANGANPAQQSLQITNVGGGTLFGLGASTSYAAAQPTGWLSLAISGTTAPATLFFIPATGSLAPGTYTATVSVTSAVAANSPQTVAVTFTVTAGAPIITLTPASRSFAATAGGGNPAAQTVQIGNGGSGTLSGLTRTISYQAGQPAGWLTATLGATTGPTTITLNAATGALVAGTYNATVAIGATGASNSPQNIAVTFTVAPPTPTITLTPNSRSFTATAGGANPASQTVQIGNGGGGSLTGLGRTISYQAGQPTGWLTATFAATTAPTNLTLSPATGTLPAGTYNATVAVTSVAAANSPQNVTVTFTVAPPTGNPQISLSATAPTFDATAGGANPANLSLQIGNSGTGSLTGLAVTENPPASWLTLTLSSTTAPATLTFQASIAGLGAGTYTTTVNVTSPVASNSPRSVTVTLNVAAAQATATRFVNDASYPVIYLTIDGVQHFPTAPQGFLPGQTYTVNLPAGTHTYEARTGFWDGGSRFEMYVYGGTFTQQSGVTGTRTISDVTIQQLLTQFGTTGYWEGLFFENTTPHVAGFRFRSNGTWTLYVDGVQQSTGNYTLVSRTPSLFLVTFSVGGYQGQLIETQGSFQMPNGPASWRVIEYTYQGP